MRKGLIALALAAGLSGCAGVPGTLFNIATKSVANPVTKDDLYQVENAMTVAFAALEAYKKSCVAGAVGSGCKGIITKIQVYTRQIPPLLTQLRGFVKNNDQVDAATVYDQIETLIANFKAAAAANGVEVQ